MVIRGGGPVYNEVCCSYRGITNSLPRKLYAGVLETRFHPLVEPWIQDIWYSYNNSERLACVTTNKSDHFLVELDSIHDRGNKLFCLFWLSRLFKTSYIHTFTYGHNLWVVTKSMRSLIQAMEMSFLRHGMRFCDI